MKELAQALIAESAHVAPAHALQAVPEDLAHRPVPGAPHTIYQELWHVVFWQGIELDWIAGRETPYPETNPFPDGEDTAQEPWADLCRPT